MNAERLARELRAQGDRLGAMGRNAQGSDLRRRADDVESALRLLAEAKRIPTSRASSEPTDGQNGGTDAD